MASIQELTRLKKDIESARQNHTRAEGKLEELMEELESEYGCSTLAAAKKKLEKLKEKKNTLKENLQTGIQEVLDEYDIED